MSIKKKRVLFMFFIVVIILSVRFYFVINDINSQKEETQKTDKPDYEESMRLAISDFENGKSALIYKDYEKAKQLYKKAKDHAYEIYPSSNLYNEAKDLIDKIEKEEKDLEELIKKIEEEKEKNKMETE